MEYWVSQARHFCETCKVWLSNHASNIRDHELSQKHQDNVQRNLLMMRLKEREEKQKQEEIANEIDRINKAAEVYSQLKGYEASPATIHDTNPTDPQAVCGESAPKSSGDKTHYQKQKEEVKKHAPKTTLDVEQRNKQTAALLKAKQLLLEQRKKKNSKP